jgi:hypothetical protein
VSAVVCEVGRRHLMRPGNLDSVINERTHHIWVGPVGPRLGSSLLRRQVRDMTQWMFVRIGTFDRAGKQFTAEIRHFLPPAPRDK